MMRIAFGNSASNPQKNFLEVVQKHQNDTTPEALRQKQEALLRVVEEEVVGMESQWYSSQSYSESHNDFTERSRRRYALLDIYTNVMAHIQAFNKGNPLDNLERLEKLMKSEGSGQ